jgi:probable rRNA maturation factor
MKSALSIQRASRLANIPSDRLLRKWLRAAFDSVSPKTAAEVTLRIVNAAEGRSLNSAFRGKDYATNVLTFVYHEPSSPRLMGDLVLCAPVVAKEAREQAKSVAEHYAHLCVHGVLHLAGFDHEAARDAKRMEALEVTVLAGLRIANPYD